MNQIEIQETVISFFIIVTIGPVFEIDLQWEFFFIKINLNSIDHNNYNNDHDHHHHNNDHYHHHDYDHYDYNHKNMVNWVFRENNYNIFSIVDFNL